MTYLPFYEQIPTSTIQIRYVASYHCRIHSWLVATIRMYLSERTVDFVIIMKDDMVNDAAQYFARYIHDNWSRYLAREQNSSSVNIVLIFISTLDRICYISSGNRLAAVLPWWRLEHVVQDMKQDLQKRQIGDAIVIAIDDLTSLLIGGPPSFRDRVNDFLQRFGIVILFTVFTFTFATLGECRESRRRIFFADRRSRMNATERESARLLQKVFRTKSVRCWTIVYHVAFSPSFDHFTHMLPPGTYHSVSDLPGTIRTRHYDNRHGAIVR